MGQMVGVGSGTANYGSLGRTQKRSNLCKQIHTSILPSATHHETVLGLQSYVTHWGTT